MMHKFWKYLRDVVQCIRSSYCIDKLLYLFLQRNSTFKHTHMGAFNVSCGMCSNFVSLILKDSDMDSENVNLIQLSVPDGQKTCIAKDVSSIGI